MLAAGRASGTGVNLRPYQPAAWSDRIVVSNVPGTHGDTAPLTSTDTLYVDWAVVNDGTSQTPAIFHSALLVDGVQVREWYTDPPLDPNFYVSVSDYAIGSLPPGLHTFTIVADSTDAISENTENDNRYTKTINVTEACSYSIAPSAQSFEAPGGTGTVAVVAGAGCAWSATSNETVDLRYVGFQRQRRWNGRLLGDVE